jgi:excisionase family DNA binding protein
MENVVLTQLSTIELKELFRGELETFFEERRADVIQASAESSRLVSEKELCEFLNISGPTAIRWRQKGKIPYLQVGNSIRYDLSKVTKALSK